MKKAFSYMMILSMLVMSLIIPTEVYKAYEANLSVGVSASTVKIGDTVTVTVKVPGAVSGPVSLYFPTDVMEYVSASTETSVVGGTIQFSIGKGGRAASDTVTVKLKAKTEGSATLKVEATGDIYDYDSLEEVVLKGTSAKVTVENQTSNPDTGNNNGGDTTPEPPKSEDNSLASLKLSSGTLSPGFKYNVTKYTATVGYDVEKVVVSAKTSNEKATIESVTGNGTVNLKVGENTIQIVVKAENGVKATYTIVVTRKAQETTVEPQPSEDESQSDSESESTAPEVNEFLQYNGEQLTLIEEIPAEKIPTGFESQLLVVNGQQMQGLSFANGDLKVLYLNNTNGAGSLYVYDEAQQMIYPFIKLASEHNYVMVLMPNEQEEPVPEGFESCTFSIEGKGTIKAYRMKEEVEEETMSWNPFAPEIFHAAPAKASEIYLIYCMNNQGEKGWYMYDIVEETYMRYFAVNPSVPVGGEISDSSDLQDKYDALQKELNTSKKTQYIIIGCEAAVILVLIIVVIILIMKKRKQEEDFYAEYEESYADYKGEEELEEPVANEAEEDDVKIESCEIELEMCGETEDDETGDDEIEIEFYEMELEADTEEAEASDEAEDDEMEIEFYEMELEADAEAAEDNKTEDDEMEIEFYEIEPETVLVEEVPVTEELPEEEIPMEEVPVAEEMSVAEVPVTEEIPEEIPEEIKSVRKSGVKNLTSKFSSKKADDDDDLEFIEFE